MSHAYARQTHPPPPPPPPPSQHHSSQPVAAPPPLSVPAAPDQQPRRPVARALGISTALTAAQRFGSHLQPQTPSSPRVVPPSPASPLISSASPSSTLSSPMASSRLGPSAPTSAYNPQEWARAGASAGQYVPHAAMQHTRRVVSGTRDVSGMESAMPSPPPPYSASPQSAQAQSRAQYGSPLAASFTSSQTSSPVQRPSDFNSPITPATSASTGGFPSMQRSSSGDHIYQSSSTQQQQQQQRSPTAFPPPPPAGQRDRSSSRSRFGLSAITGRSRTNSNASLANVADTAPQQANVGLGRAPAPSPTSVFTVPANTAPTARRAASTGCITSSSSGPTRRPADALAQPNPNGPQNYGFALPPPPPGPPPNARSQSLNRAGDGSQFAAGNSLSAPVALRAANLGNQLGPVPPTPADWVEEDVVRQQTPRASATGEVPASSDGSADASMRDPSVSRGIRERRSEARARAHGTYAESQPSPEHLHDDAATGTEPGQVKPANLVLSSSSSALGRRRHVNKAKTSPLVDGSVSPGIHRRRLDSDGAQRSLPASAAPMSEPFPRGPTPTTPHSAIGAPLTGDERPRARDLPSPSLALAGLPSDRTDFAETSLQRHRRFLEQEAKASSNQERLELFAKFFVNESRLRREKYSEAFDGLGSDVLELTRDLWRPLEGSRRTKTPTPSSALSDHFASSDQQTRPEQVSLPPEPSSAGSASHGAQSAALTPATEPESPADLAANHARIRSESRNAFQPMLSPIPSMAMSTAADEESVRGRSASRWWEASSDGLSSGTGGKVHRSKRESKYMGLPREARENLQWIPEDSPGLPGPSSSYGALGPNEYPAEKVGWHESVQVAPPDTTRQTPRTPNIPRLDVSRLITLPPPYPRHHPAVNNSHPDLGSLRGTLRSLNATEDVDEVRRKYELDEKTAAVRPESPSDWSHRRKKLRQAIQQQVSLGAMSFAEAARTEADFDSTEAKRGRERAQQSFNHFQIQVVSPLNTQYNSKINQASAAIELLVEGLSNDANSHNPNATQEEGDEQPELLEKLTLVKWLHEAREQLYKDMMELENESNERYKSIILFPYRQSGNKEKVQEVESFFAKDLDDRREDYEKKCLKRFEEQLRVMEKHVMRGVETQLSAFWDIAPELMAVIQKVPGNLSECELLIPSQEYEENPSYDEFPLQYLYTLLLHAERSAFQFIESQINLQCLLHEAKTSVMTAGCRLMQLQRVVAGEDTRSVEQEMKEIGRSEDATLTADLKDRVSVVEEQWKQALGVGIRECQQRIKRRLMEQGGFDESLDE